MFYNRIVTSCALNFEPIGIIMAAILDSILEAWLATVIKTKLLEGNWIRATMLEHKYSINLGNWTEWKTNLGKIV